jgi:hypothetical protein
MEHIELQQRYVGEIYDGHVGERYRQRYVGRHFAYYEVDEQTNTESVADYGDFKQRLQNLNNKRTFEELTTLQIERVMMKKQSEHVFNI